MAKRSLAYCQQLDCSAEGTSKEKQTTLSDLQASKSVAPQTFQDDMSLNLFDESSQNPDECLSVENQSSYCLLNYTVTPEKIYPSDCSHSSQNTVLEGSPRCLSFDEKLKSDHSTDSDSMDQNEFVDDGSEGDDLSINSIDSSDSIDQDSINSSYYSDDETDSENLMEKENDNLGIPEKEFQALSFVSCFLRSKFSGSTSRDVIDTFKSTFPHCEELSNLDFEKIMSNIEDISLKVFHYCILCKQVFPSDEDIFRCTTPNCEGLRYKGALSNQKKKGRQPVQCFVFTDVKKQLVDLLKTPGIWKDIQGNREAAFERKNNRSMVLTDITDGECYRAMMGDDLFLDKAKNNLTAIFNTDGVNLYSSSKVELWPIFLAINELSPAQRFSRNNILLLGLWQGKGKPPFQAFLQIFTDEMNTLYTEGVEVQIDEETYSVKLSVLCGITDLPAKAELLNMSYFNGEYACITCEEPGLTVKQGKGHAKCYPYRNVESRYSGRSHENVIINMNTGSDKKRSKGFKGTSELVNLQNYNIVDGTVPDYMQGVLLGITKTLLSKWFSPSESQKEHFIGKHIKIISKRMKNIKPPVTIERLPRNLEKHYQHFKATELQSWLLYYSIPCVKGFFGDEYMENLACLANAVYILLGDEITQSGLEKAADLLNQFYSSFQRLYGYGSCGLNVHNTSLHLPEYVKLWGQIWCCCFPFEDANSMLLQAVHGTGNVLKQVMKYRQATLNIRKKGLDLKKTTTWKITVEATNCDIAGATKKLGESENWVKEQIALLQPNTDCATKVDRVIVNNTKFFSEGYSRMQKRICNIVRYSGDSIGAIKYFVVVCENLVNAVVKKMEKIQPSQLPEAPVVSHLIPVEFSETLVIVNVEELCEVLVFIDTRLQANSEDTYYVCRLPNRYGHSVFK